MPLRLALPRPATRPPIFLLPFLHHPSSHCRYASILGSLSDKKSAYNKRKRLGRGPASGKGKTSGRGHKGQKQHGKVPAGFEGGQTPQRVVHGERGFDNIFALDLARINVDRIQEWIDQGRLDNTRPITLKELHRSRCTHGIKDGVKLLARNAGELRSPIHITVSRASASAIAAVEAAGGSVTTRYYTRTSIRRVIRGESHPTLSLLSQPPAWLTSPPTAASSLKSPHTVTTAEFSTSSSPNSSAADASSVPQDPIMSKANKVVMEQDPFLEPLVAEIRKYKYRLPDPAGRKDIEYYRDPAHRGYLSYQLRDGQGPSLFFKTPTEIATGAVGKERKARASKAENKLW